MSCPAPLSSPALLDDVVRFRCSFVRRPRPLTTTDPRLTLGFRLTSSARHEKRRNTHAGWRGSSSTREQASSGAVQADRIGGGRMTRQQRKSDPTSRRRVGASACACVLPAPRVCACVLRLTVSECAGLPLPHVQEERQPDDQAQRHQVVERSHRAPDNRRTTKASEGGGKAKRGVAGGYGSGGGCRRGRRREGGGELHSSSKLSRLTVAGERRKRAHQRWRERETRQR